LDPAVFAIHIAGSKAFLKPSSLAITVIPYYTLQYRRFDAPPAFGLMKAIGNFPADRIRSSGIYMVAEFEFAAVAGSNMVQN
jgi:hypothetical protein